MPTSSSIENLAGTPQRILVVDDDPAILRLVKDKLDRAGFEVFIAASGQNALEVIGRQGLPHLAIVDINMPGMDGFAFCRAVQEFSDLPVIMLTAVDEEETVIQGIEYYAEDYVTKPFSPRELTARIKAVLRRTEKQPRTAAVIRAADVTLDKTSRLVTVKDQTVNLTPSEFELLAILMTNPGRAFSRAELLDYLQGIAFEGVERTIDVHIRNLRTKIEPNPRSPRYVETVFGIGYRFSTASTHHKG